MTDTDPTTTNKATPTIQQPVKQPDAAHDTVPRDTAVGTKPAGSNLRPARKISLALAGRLSRYREIVDRARAEGKTYISSESCGRELNVDGTLVRKDMACLGVVGKPHVGYPVSDIVAALDRLVREQTQRAAVLVGAGHLATAIINAGTLQHHGVHLEAVFDNDVGKIGTSLGRHRVDSLDVFESRVEETGARLGVVTVPGEAAQGVIDRMAKAGIRVIWNFAPIRQVIPIGVKILNEHLVESVGRLSRYLDEMDPPKPASS